MAFKLIRSSFVSKGFRQLLVNVDCGYIVDCNSSTFPISWAMRTAYLTSSFFVAFAQNQRAYKSSHYSNERMAFCNFLQGQTEKSKYGRTHAGLFMLCSMQTLKWRSSLSVFWKWFIFRIHTVRRIVVKMFISLVCSMVRSTLFHTTLLLVKSLHFRYILRLLWKWCMDRNDKIWLLFSFNCALFLFADEKIVWMSLLQILFSSRISFVRT